MKTNTSPKSLLALSFILVAGVLAGTGCAASTEEAASNEPETTTYSNEIDQHAEQARQTEEPGATLAKAMLPQSSDVPAADYGNSGESSDPKPPSRQPLRTHVPANP